jgi:hypothetical protein
MKRYLLLLSLAFVVTLAGIFSLRASVDALAVILGVVLGVAATGPTTLLLLYILLRQQKQQSLSEPPHPVSPQPPVVVINTSDKPAGFSPPMLSRPPAATGRQWTVIGEAETLD